MKEQGPSAGIGEVLDEGEEDTMPPTPLHSWSIKLYVSIRGAGGEKLLIG